MNVSLVARKRVVGASQLFNRRRPEREGRLRAVTAGESVVPASELAASILGSKTMATGIVEDAVEFAYEKSRLDARPC